MHNNSGFMNQYGADWFDAQLSYEIWEQWSWEGSVQAKHQNMQVH